MRHQLPGTRRRKRFKGIMKPQHRMVLGLVSMSAAALMLSLMYAKEDTAGAGIPADSSTRSIPRAAVPVPTGRVPVTTEATSDAISAAVRSVGPAIQGCLEAFAPDLKPWEGIATTIELQLGRTGLERADVLRMRGAPAPFLGCLGAGLADAAWPSGGEDIVLVRVPLVVEARPVVVPLGG